MSTLTIKPGNDGLLRLWHIPFTKSLDFCKVSPTGFYTEYAREVKIPADRFGFHGSINGRVPESFKFLVPHEALTPTVCPVCGSAVKYVMLCPDCGDILSVKP